MNVHRDRVRAASYQRGRVSRPTSDEPALNAATGDRAERDELMAQLERIQQEFERRALSSMAEPLISTPLTMQQLKVLTMIAIDPEKATGHELAGLLKVSVATMSGIIDRLVEHGVVLRTEDPADRRVRRLTVTSKGGEMIRGLLSTTGTIPVPVLDRMAAEDLRALVQGLRAIDQASRELQDERGP